MKWEITVNGQPVEPGAPEGECIEAPSIEQVEPGIYSVIAGNRSFDVHIAPSADGWEAQVSGRPYKVQARDARDAGRATRAARSGGRHNVVASMPGKIVRVLVRTGETVEAGQGLVVVEAMKMQNEIKAPYAGKAVEVRAAEGGTVAAGDVLVVIE